MMEDSGIDSDPIIREDIASDLKDKNKYSQPHISPTFQISPALNEHLDNTINLPANSADVESCNPSHDVDTVNASGDTIDEIVDDRIKFSPAVEIQHSCASPTSSIHSSPMTSSIKKRSALSRKLERAKENYRKYNSNNENKGHFGADITDGDNRFNILTRSQRKSIDDVIHKQPRKKNALLSSKQLSIPLPKRTINTEEKNVMKPSVHKSSLDAIGDTDEATTHDHNHIKGKLFNNVHEDGIDSSSDDADQNHHHSHQNQLVDVIHHQHVISEEPLVALSDDNDVGGDLSDIDEFSILHNKSKQLKSNRLNDSSSNERVAAYNKAATQKLIQEDFGIEIIQADESEEGKTMKINHSGGGVTENDEDLELYPPKPIVYDRCVCCNRYLGCSLQ